jgi:Undecaprenyl-phosphate galactose phosphotransferase WbaP
MFASRLRSLLPAWIPTLFFFLSDTICVALSFSLAFLLRKYAPFLPPLAHGFDLYIAAWPFILLWPLLFLRERLYPGYWLSRREELQRLTTGTTLAGLILMTGTFLTQTGIRFSRPIVVGGWLIALALIPIARYAIRRVITNFGISGSAAVMLGAGATARIFIDGLKNQMPPSLLVKAIFDDDIVKIGTEIKGVRVLGPIDQATDWARSRGINTVVIAMPGISRQRLVPIIEEQSKAFQWVIIVPDLFGISVANVDTIEVQSVLALKLRKNLLVRSNRVLKRLIDMILVIVGSVLVLPLAGVIMLAILIESGRPVLFKHERIGKGGMPFSAWKFRSMIHASAQVIEEYLALHPEIRDEWDDKQKLQSDPRLTKIGRILRRLSLDELPQFWNIVKGEMSLVGPRPIIKEEIQKYGDNFDLYTQVRPGLTGLWQVSGRSDLPYKDRVWLDAHYVRNWSIWLDLIILIRSVWVVIAGIGAY